MGSSKLPGGDLELRIGVLVDTEDQFEAMSRGMAVIKTSLLAVKIGDPKGLLGRLGPEAPLTSSARQLQPA